MSSTTLKPLETNPSPAHARSGQAIGGYIIGDELASGGMGIVYRATKNGEPFAIKFLRATEVANEERKRRFLREAKVVAALDHPGIVRAHDIGDVDGEVFIVMDLVEGRSLREWIDDLREGGGAPNVADAVRIARGVAEAVVYAHGKGIVHRDLKPDNVMVDPRGHVRVLDFGLAKMREIEGGAVYEAETETSLTHEGRVLGTPGYMAPEQAAGKEVSFRADVFALGAILYEMLTATRAFTGSSPMDILVSLTRDDPPPPSSKNASVGPTLDALVARCLSKAATDRPAMEEVARDLAQPALSVEKKIEASDAKRSTRRDATVIALASVAVLSLTVLGVTRWTANAAQNNGAASSAGVTAPAVVPTAVTELPVPVSSVDAAVAVYKSALAHEREGAEDAALVELEKATVLDPEMAAAHLRAALRLAYFESESAHVHFAKAVQFRDKLSPRDADVLEAAQPLLQRDPADAEAWARGLRALVAKWPGDAELAYELGGALDVLGDFEGEALSDERAVMLDPSFGLARSALASTQAYLGHFDAARDTVAKCLERSPNATWCLWVTEFVNGAEGHCTDASARARIAIDPSLSTSYLELFYALMAKGEPTAGAKEAIDQVVSRTHDEFRAHRMRLSLTILFEQLSGDFVAATAHATELRALVEKSADTSTRANATIVSGQIAVETGHPELAAAFAKDFLARRTAWQSPPIAHDYSLSDDTLPIILSFAYHAGAMPKADFDHELTTWRAKWDALLRGSYRPYLWVYGYAALAQTSAEAADAIAALPRYEPIPPFIPNGTLPVADVGRTLWLSGREAEGISYLEKAAHSCAAGTQPIPWVRAHAWLAEALAKRGDVEGACRENAVVLARWGNAKPRSVTADAARVLAHTLRCK